MSDAVPLQTIDLADLKLSLLTRSPELISFRIANITEAQFEVRVTNDAVTIGREQAELNLRGSFSMRTERHYSQLSQWDSSLDLAVLGAMKSTTLETVMADLFRLLPSGGRWTTARSSRFFKTFCERLGDHIGEHEQHYPVVTSATPFRRPFFTKSTHYGSYRFLNFIKAANPIIVETLYAILDEFWPTAWSNTYDNWKIETTTRFFVSRQSQHAARSTWNDTTAPSAPAPLGKAYRDVMDDIFHGLDSAHSMAETLRALINIRNRAASLPIKKGTLIAHRHLHTKTMGVPE